MSQLSFETDEKEKPAEKARSKTNLLQVRLSKEDVAERDARGMNDKEYFNFKINQQPSPPIELSRSMSNTSTDVATIRKGVEAEMENKFLKQQIEQLKERSNTGLAGLGDLVKVEMEKYKHDQEVAKLREDNVKYQADIKELEADLEEAENDRDALFKKVQMIEIAKEVGPHLARAVKGYQEKGIGGALGELANSMNGFDESHNASIPEGEENLQKIKFATRFLTLFPEPVKQQQIMTLLAEMSATPWLADKVEEYINALKNTNQTA